MNIFYFITAIFATLKMTLFQNEQSGLEINLRNVRRVIVLQCINFNTENYDILYWNYSADSRCNIPCKCVATTPLVYYPVDF